MPGPETSLQQQTFDEQGYLHLPGVLAADMVEALTELVDANYEAHRAAGYDPYLKRAFDASRPFFYPNFLKDDQRFVNLLDHPKVFPLVYTVLGWNIYSYHSHYIVTPPRDTTDRRGGRFGFHQDSGRVNVELDCSPRPRLSIKVSYWLSDCDEVDRGNLFVVPGSHREDRIELPEDGSAPAGAVPVLCRAGDVVLFDRRMWHSASPNNSNVVRKALFIGYGYRWLRTKDDMTISSRMLAANDPVRRQLLGEATDANGQFSPKPGQLPLHQWMLDVGLTDA